MAPRKSSSRAGSNARSARNTKLLTSSSRVVVVAVRVLVRRVVAVPAMAHGGRGSVRHGRPAARNSGSMSSLAFGLKPRRSRHLGDRHRRRNAPPSAPRAVHVPQAVLQPPAVPGIHQIGLVDEDLVGKADLALRLDAVVQPLRRVWRRPG